MTELQKIGLACFIGAIVCSGVAVLIGPLAFSTNLLAGIVIGAAAGYLCYDLKEVLVAIPRAWDQAKQSTHDLHQWLVNVPHPVGFTTLFGGIVIVGLLHVFLASLSGGIRTGNDLIAVTIMSVLLGVIGTILLFCSIQVLMTLGAFTLGYTRKSMDNDNFYRPFNWIGPRPRRRFSRKIVIDYRSAPLLFLLGAVTILPWGLLFIVLVLVAVITLVVKFIWNLFKRIHSSNRIICAVDGPIGGCVAYFGFVQDGATMDAIVVYILLGGVLGSLIGIANKELVAKRWLKLA